MWTWSLGVGLIFATPVALAQTAPAAEPESSEASAALAEPVLLPVADHLLAPIPPASNVLKSWRDALRTLHENSTSLRSLRAQEDVARAQARQALAPALPRLAAGAGVTRQLLHGSRRELIIGQTDAGATDLPAFSSASVTVPDPPTTWQAASSLRVPLLALATWHDRGTALKQVDASRLSTMAGERLAVALVADAVVATVTAERLAEISRISLESALSVLALSKHRSTLGAGSKLDVLRLEQEVSLSRAQVVASNDALLQARESLGAALGSAEPFGVAADIKLDELANDVKTSCGQSDILDRADVRSAEVALAIAKDKQEGAVKAYWPTIDAVSELVFSSPVSSVNNRHTTWSIGAVLNWTIYDGGSREATRAERGAETRIAAEQLSDTRRRARFEVMQSLRAVKSSEATLGVAARTRDIAVETAKLTRLSYLNGAGTSLDLVDAARREREAEVSYVIKQFEVVRAKIAALVALAICKV